MKSEKNGHPSNDCFVLMPIADPEGYDKGHFKKVYDDIFKVAIEKAGFNPVRADDVKQTNLIHLDILQKLIHSPMAICDLSSRNPNVLFELGLRQAFDKPTVLVQEMGTPKIFDISPLRYTEYRKELKYREVLEDQQLIAESLMDTQKATQNGEGVNSLISLLSLTNPAKLKEGLENDTSKMLQVVMSEMSELRTELRTKFQENISRRVLHREEDLNDFPGVPIDEIYNEFINRTKIIKALIQSKKNESIVSAEYKTIQSVYAHLRKGKLSGAERVKVKDNMSLVEAEYTKYIADRLED